MHDFVPSDTYLREEITALHEEGYDTAEAARLLTAIAGHEGTQEERRAIGELLRRLTRRTPSATRAFSPRKAWFS